MMEIPQSEFNYLVKRANAEIKQDEQPGETREVMASYVPRFNCKSGHCQQIHDNPNFENYPRGKCTNCDQFSKHDHGKCTWCGSDDIDSIDSDDIEDVINFEEKKDGW